MEGLFWKKKKKKNLVQITDKDSWSSTLLSWGKIPLKF